MVYFILLVFELLNIHVLLNPVSNCEFNFATVTAQNQLILRHYAACMYSEARVGASGK